MLNMILLIFSSVFDMALLSFYMDVFWKKNKKKISTLFYYGAFIAAGILLLALSYAFYGIHSGLRAALNLSAGLLTTFALTFFYRVRLSARCYITLSYQVLCGIMEYLTAVIMLTVGGLHMETLGEIEPVLLVFSKICLLIAIQLIDAFWRKKDRDSFYSYHLLLLLIPVFSLILILAIPVSVYRSVRMYPIVISMIILNILNYYLLDNVLQASLLRKREKQLLAQIDFQSEKYQQISAAYRNTRSLMHDTKKHFFFIQDCLQNKNYDGILEYMEQSIQSLERTYNKINTGNLVIDAFISNYLEIAEAESIQFSTNIKVSAGRVPVEDYDLCVIIGNLMDNSMKAVRKVALPYPKRVKVEIITDVDRFVIHVKNTRERTMMQTDSRLSADSLYHGYGITNIKNMVAKYQGTYTCFPETDSFDTIIVIPVQNSF